MACKRESLSRTHTHAGRKFTHKWGFFFDDSLGGSIPTDLTQELDLLLRSGLFCDRSFNHLVRFLDVGILEINQDSPVELKVPENVLTTQVPLLNT